MENFISKLSGKKFPAAERVKVGRIRQPVKGIILDDHNDLADEDFIALSELNEYRQEYITRVLRKEVDWLSEIDYRTVDVLNERSVKGGSLSQEVTTEPDTGQRIADKVASFGGSWTFILSFLGFLVLWIALNGVFLANKGFDPYPFILLNLFLSCIAAVQAPIIMMSQNRQEAKDREKAQQDYMVNLKAELEIHFLHEKMDHLLIHQQQELLEIQKMQMDTMNEILNSLHSKHEKKS
ncbi:MAG: DUF1003 domain-containing protein [Bacteroidia bacterium]|nr:DUF1003 domain-containing protein [Bacteroidia bacterium]